VTDSNFLRLALLLATTVPAGPALGQPAEPRWEVGVSLGAGPQMTGIFKHRYTLTLADHPEATGFAGQDVSLRGDTGVTLAASVTRMFDHHLGLEFVLAAARAPLGGSSSDYAWALQYTSRQPPDYQPQPLEVTGSTPWPTTDGRLRELALAANLVVRYPVYDKLSVSFSGGIAVQRFEGEIHPLGVTLFFEGSQATLSSETYRVRVAFGPVYTPGLDLGSEFVWRLDDRLSLAFEVRYFAAQSVRLTPEVDRVLNNGEVIDQATPAELNQQAPLQHVEFDPSFGAVFAGIRYRI
jgi:hypothetical protein